MPKYSYKARIKAQLSDLGKTQKDLAQAIGYSPQYLSKILDGDVHVPNTKEAIAKILAKWKEEQNGT